MATIDELNPTPISDEFVHIDIKRRSAFGCHSGNTKLFVKLVKGFRGAKEIIIE